jgi:hypothetical protein
MLGEQNRERLASVARNPVTALACSLGGLTTVYEAIQSVPAKMSEVGTGDVLVAGGWVGTGVVLGTLATLSAISHRDHNQQG